MNAFISFEAGQDRFMGDLSRALSDAGVMPISVNLKGLYGNDIGEMAGPFFSRLNCILVVVSHSYLKSSWLKKELKALLKWEKVNRENNLILLKVDDCEATDEIHGRPMIDFTNRDFTVAFKELLASVTQQRRAFIIMQIGDKHLDSAYKGVIVPVMESFHYKALRIDKVQDSKPINLEILEEIQRSKLVFADFTNHRPNCYFEAGYAMALGKQLILTIHKDSLPIHFDLAPNRFIVWETEDELRNELHARFSAIAARGDAD